MKKFFFIPALVLVVLFCAPMEAQNLKLKGTGHMNRYDNGDQMESTWIGSLYDEEGHYTGVTAFIVEYGIYAMNWNGTSLSTPEKEPAVNINDIKQGNQVDFEKAIWANNFNLMYGNSGAAYFDGQLITVMSRDEQSTTDDELFSVRRWDAKTGNLLTTEDLPKSAGLESAGMAYNPIDGKVYGLFYRTGQPLPSEITEDPDYFQDEDDDLTDGDAGYCLCAIDLQTLKVTPITPGLYYYNFITFAINSEGRAFALTSGGSSGYLDDNGKLRNADHELVGAQLCEFDLNTGLIITNAVFKTDDNNEEYIDYEFPVQGTGYSSQYRRQAACFAKSNPNKMYWIGYVNSGKGINNWGSWSSLSDKEWRTNGKYDTALYEVDVNTGEATMLSKVQNRWIFSALWVDGDDASDGAGLHIVPESVASLASSTAPVGFYNISGQFAGTSLPQQPGVYITRPTGKKVVVK